MRLTRRVVSALAVLALLVVPAVAPAQNSPFPLVTTVTLQNAAQATGNGTVMGIAQFGIILIQTAGTFVGTVTYEGTVDGTNWAAMTCYTIGGSSGVTTATAAAVVRCNAAGWVGLRARVSAYTSGSITVTANGTSLGLSPLATTN